MKALLEQIRDLRGVDLRAEAAPDGTVTILFTDIENSTPLTEQLGDLRAQELLNAHNAIIREQVAAQRGFEVKSMGDGFMIAFSSARRALLCAIAIQRAFAAYSAANPGTAIRVSIGVHTGEAIKQSGDFYGKAVIIASRIGARARGGEILVSSTLKELTENTGDLQFDEGREVELKGLAGSYRLYSALWDSAGS
jgi:class 3 adenylate cyclase